MSSNHSDLDTTTTESERVNAPAPEEKRLRFNREKLKNLVSVRTGIQAGKPCVASVVF
jgi:hypothetical protein